MFFYNIPFRDAFALLLFTEEPLDITLPTVFVDLNGDFTERLIGLLAYSFQLPEELSVDDIWVNPEERCKGYGSLMMDYIEKIAKDKKCKTASLMVISRNPLKARTFYEKHGFTLDIAEDTNVLTMTKSLE